MQVIRRSMEVLDDQREDTCEAQASFNSDGRLTLRMYDPDDPNEDTIIVFDARQTNAIVNLFRKIAKRFPEERDLPF